MIPAAHRSVHTWGRTDAEPVAQRMERSDMVPRSSRWTGWAVVLALATAGCGGGEENSQEPSAAPSPALSAPASAPSEAPASEEQAGAPERYVVESGDTLTDIARRFDTTVEALVDANDIADPDVIDIGQELVIPGSR